MSFSNYVVAPPPLPPPKKHPLQHKIPAHAPPPPPPVRLSKNPLYHSEKYPAEVVAAALKVPDVAVVVDAGPPGRKGAASVPQQPIAPRVTEALRTDFVKKVLIVIIIGALVLAAISIGIGVGVTSNASASLGSAFSSVTTGSTATISSSTLGGSDVCAAYYDAF